MTFKTVLTPYIDAPITREEYGCMELYLVSKHHHPLTITLTKNMKSEHRK